MSVRLSILKSLGIHAGTAKSGIGRSRQDRALRTSEKENMTTKERYGGGKSSHDDDEDENEDERVNNIACCLPLARCHYGESESFQDERPKEAKPKSSFLSSSS